jgi:hypothetical protein
MLEIRICTITLFSNVNGWFSLAYYIFQMLFASDAFQDSCTGWSRDLPWEGNNSEPAPSTSNIS